MHLFKAKGIKTKPSLNSLSLTTPLNNIILNVKSNLNSLVCVTPTDAISLSSKAEIIGWDDQKYRLELLKMKFDPKIPPGMNIQDCYAFVWRICPKTEAMDFELDCIINGSSEFEFDIGSGEGLMSETFTSATNRLTIGTEDIDYLESRAEYNLNFPSRLKSSLSTDIIECLGNGLKINLPKLLPNEIAQIQFIVAWSTFRENDSSTWFAVDQRPNDLFKQAGC